MPNTQHRSTESQPASANRFQGVVREWAPVLLFLLLALVARSTLADHYHVPTSSMEGALVPGDHVLVDKSAFGLRIPFTKTVVLAGDRPVPGDVVIFDSPDDGTRLIKRVVAVGGETVAVRGGRVFTEGAPRFTLEAPATERYGAREVLLKLDSGGGPSVGPVRVPDGHVLVLGDHRGNSRDGRYFGFVPEAALYGRAQGVFWRASEGPTWYRL